jgi:periplasmic protein TonB
MKTIEKAYNTAVHAENLEDIVFEGRNQTYGAYFLRRNYNTHVNLSTLAVISMASLIVLVAYVRTMNQPVIVKPVVPTLPTGPIVIDDINKLIPPPSFSVELPKTILDPSKYAPIIVDEATGAEQPIIEDFAPATEPPDPNENVTIIPVGPNGPSTVIPEEIKEPWEVEEPPIFEGDFRKWLAKNIYYPEIAQTNQIFGSVTVRFAVNTDGSITDISVLKGIHPLLDQAVVNALIKSPKWKPAKYNGNLVKSFFYLPVKFDLENFN